MNEEKKKKNNSKIKKDNTSKKNNANRKDKESSKKVNEKNNLKKSNVTSKEDRKTSEKKILVKKEEKITNEVTIDKKKKNEDNDAKVVETKKAESKAGIIILTLILLCVLGLCIYYQIDNKNSNNASNTNTEDSNEIIDEFYKYFNSKKVKVIFYARSSCGYCKLEQPIMDQISEDYNLDYLHIDSDKLTTKDREKILKELNIEQATPTTVVVKDGKVLGKQVGYVDGGEMVEFLKDYKVLDKDAVYSPEQYLTFVDYDEYNDILSESGKHIVTIGQTGCSHCTATKPVLNQIAKDYNIVINYLNITEMSQSEINSFTNGLSEIGYDDKDFLEKGSFGTPLTLIIENGHVISYVSGERPTAQFIRAFKKAGIITE